MKSERTAGSIVLRIALYLALFVVFAFLLAGPGSRLAWWDFRTGFAILRFGFYGAVFALILWVIGIYLERRNRSWKTLLKQVPTLLVILTLIFIPLSLIRSAKMLPRIHDITTDFENPPSFNAILPLRKDSPNTAEYGGTEVSILQQKAYPDIKPLFLSISPDQVFKLALGRAKELNWQIVNADSSERRIEATDTTFWFGFKDDIVIRITPSPQGGSRVDLRSVSRIGLSDVGTNARRIRHFIEKFPQSN